MKVTLINPGGTEAYNTFWVRTWITLGPSACVRARAVPATSVVPRCEPFAKNADSRTTSLLEIFGMLG